jgi:hypothetical protein
MNHSKIKNIRVTKYDLDRSTCVVVIWLSFWSLIPRDEWWFRGADFPRLQILFVGLIALVLMLFWTAPWDLAREVILFLLMHLSFSIKMVLPYTFIWKNRSNR